MNTTKEFKLLKIDNKRRNELLQSTKDIIINDKKELIYHINESLENNNSNKILHLGIIPKETIIRIKKEIQNIKKEKIDKLLDENISYDLVISYETIRHIKKESLTKKDIYNFIWILDEIIVDFYLVTYSKYLDKQNALRFKKIKNDEIFILLGIISNKKSHLKTHSLFLDKASFIKRKKKPISEV